jgi:predicted phage terminase large subunit-like protein
MTTARGFRFSTSVGGVLTGRGGDLIIADDPMKPADATSESARARLIDWYSGTLVSRLNDKANGAIIIVMQRLHQDDLVGHLLQDDGWTHLNLPAIADLEEQVEIGPGHFHIRRIGEPLHPEREPSVVIDGIKRAMGSATFAAQYQQSPVPPGGNMIDWNWFQWYRANAAPKFDRTVISWDTATKASELSDYSVATVWGEVFGFCCLRDVIRERLEYPALKRKVLDLNQQWYFATGRPPELVIEDAGLGAALIQDLQGPGIRVHAVRPVGDKVMRMSAQSAKIEQGHVYLPVDAKWLKDFRTEILAFPHGKYDDQVDSMSQALSYMGPESLVAWGA